MVFGRLFGKKEEAPEYSEPTLETMQVGYMVDYNLRTWQVTACAEYDYDGFICREWTLRGGEDIYFLEGSEADGRMVWTLTQAVDFFSFAGGLAEAIESAGDPPEMVQWSGDTYHAVESSAGLYRESGKEERPFVSWSYEGNGGSLLFISQWGDRDFSAYVGQRVEAYEFSDILPAAKE
jgi:hypothetical protein